MDQVRHRFKNFFPLAPGDKAAADVESVAADLVCLIVGILFDKTVALQRQKNPQSRNFVKAETAADCRQTQRFRRIPQKDEQLQPFHQGSERLSAGSPLRHRNRGFQHSKLYLLFRTPSIKGYESVSTNGERKTRRTAVVPERRWPGNRA